MALPAISVVRRISAATLAALTVKRADGPPVANLTEKILFDHGGVQGVAAKITEMAGNRNRLLYASDTGWRTGPPDLDHDLRELAKTTLGLLWAAVDIAQNRDTQAELVKMVLRTTVKLNKLAFPSAKARAAVTDGT